MHRLPEVTRSNWKVNKRHGLRASEKLLNNLNECFNRKSGIFINLKAIAAAHVVRPMFHSYKGRYFCSWCCWIKNAETMHKKAAIKFIWIRIALKVN